MYLGAAVGHAVSPTSVSVTVSLHGNSSDRALPWPTCWVYVATDNASAWSGGPVLKITPENGNIMSSRAITSANVIAYFPTVVDMEGAPTTFELDATSFVAGTAHLWIIGRGDPSGWFGARTIAQAGL